MTEEFVNPDPIGEYVRKCPYCHEEFTANHMNREYCPEKEGILNYCKNRHKRHVRHEREAALLNEIIDPMVEEPDDPVPATLKEVEPEPLKQVISNANIIGAHLGSQHHLKVHKDYLKHKGLDYLAYDKQYQLPGTELFGATYGPYAIVWGYENHIILTHKTHIPWIQ